MKFPKIQNKTESIIKYELIKTRQRLTLDIIWQHPETIYHGDDNGDYFKFVANNGYEIISRSRMDIQTERIWLIGAKNNERSGTMVFSSDEKRDEAFVLFQEALKEWENFVKSEQVNKKPNKLAELKNLALEWAVETLDPDLLNDNQWGLEIDKKFSELILDDVIQIADQFELEVNRSGLVDSIKNHFKN